MYLKKTPNPHGRIRLSIVDTYYDKVKKCSRQKTVESLGWLDELEEQLLPLCSHPMFNTQKSDHIIKTVVGGLARITYSYSSPYEQDRARGGGMFPGFSDAIGKNLKNTKEEDFLFLKNEFIRQKNRMRGEIDQILTAVRLQLLQWKELEQIERG